MYKKRLLHIYLFIFFGSFVSYSQIADVNFYKSKYPNKAFVYLSKSTDFDISVQDKKVIIVRKYKERRLLLTESAKSIDTRKISTNEFVEVRNVKARVLVPDKKKYNKIEVTDISLKEEGSDENFYDGEKSYILKFPSTLPGNILELEYEEIYNEPRFFGSVFLSDYYPVIHSTVTLKSPASVNLTLKEVNNQLLPLTMTRAIKKTDSLYTWTSDTIPPLPFESYSPNIKYYASYILLKVKDYKQENGTIKPVLRNTDDIYQWYAELVKNLNKTEDTHLRSLTDSLTAGLSSDLAKVQRIFYWVQDKIAYVAYEDGLGGYIPREATIICKRRFGDCKDMASLIVKMAQMAHLKVYLTWIGTRDIPYSFSDFPSPFCANHMIATFIDEKGNYIFLDGTGKLTPFGVPTSMIQGKQAFIGLTEKEYVLVDVPIIGSEKNYIRDSITCSIKKNTITGYGYFKSDGYSKAIICARISNKSIKELKEYLTALFNKGNNKFFLDSFSVMQQSKDLPLIIYYKFTLPDYLTKSNKNTYVNLNFDKDYLKDYKTIDRKIPMEFDFCFTKKMSVLLKLDPEEKTDYIPEESSDKNDIGSYSTKYELKDQSIYFENNIFLNRFFIEPSHFNAFNSLITKYGRATNKSLALIKMN